MTGTIELDRDGRTLLIRFPYREDLVDEVRNLPGRRWDKGGKVWKVPANHAEVVLSTFMRYGFDVAPEVTGILAGTTEIAAKPEKNGADKKGKSKKADKEQEPGAPWGVEELNNRVRDALLGAFPSRVQIVGEVLDFDKNKDRKHIFFTLIEKSGAEQIAAKVDVALFERTAGKVLPALAKKSLTLQDGIEILIEARIDFYPRSGRFQLIIEDIKPEFTLGKLALSREQILEELKQKGLDQRNALLPMPMPALRIGVLTSPDSDGWNDFKKELETAGIGFQIGLYPIKVQGEELRPTLLAGLKWFAKQQNEYDLLCILRGGGSRTDLAWFDDRDVAMAVAKHPMKILCGIGHQRDQSVLDCIAHSEKTPTALAAYLVDQILAARQELLDRSRRLREAGKSSLHAARRELTAQAAQLLRLLQGRLAGEGQRLREAGARLQRGSLGLCKLRRNELLTVGRRCSSAVTTLLQREQVRMQTREARQRLLDPKRVLDRGYALLRDKKNRILTGISSIRPDQELSIELRDGRVAATAGKIETKKAKKN
ncbi:MAG: exodeoxyribonuclease VII large subunit [Planctomycetota bacterium]|jgi:exodeoxyribonuclease VII large subunit